MIEWSITRRALSIQLCLSDEMAVESSKSIPMVIVEATAVRLHARLTYGVFLTFHNKEL